MVTDLDLPPNSNESAKLSQEDNSQQKQGNAKKIGLLALLAVVALGGYWLLGDRLSIECLATQESALCEYRLKERGGRASETLRS